MGGSTLIGEANDITEVLGIIGALPFTTGYSVGSKTGKDISEFIPF